MKNMLSRKISLRPHFIEVQPFTTEVKNAQRNLYSEIWPLLLFARFLGIWPFQFKKKEGYLIINKYYFIYSVLIYLGIIGCFSYGLIYETTKKNLAYVTFTLFHIFFAPSIWIHSKYMRSIYNKAIELKTNFEHRTGRELKFSLKRKIKILVLLAPLLGYLMMYTILEYEHIKYISISFFFQWYICQMVVIFISIWYTHVAMITFFGLKLLSALNEDLEFAKQKNGETIINYLILYRKLWIDLSLVSRLLTNITMTCSIFFLISFINTLNFSLKLFYMLFMNENITLIPAIKLFFGIVFNFLGVFIICDGGYSIETKLGIEFFKTLQAYFSSDSRIQKEIDIFIIFIKNYSPAIRFGKTVILNRRLFVNFFERYLTFMIILIQFIDITKSKEKEKEAIPTQLPVKS